MLREYNALRKFAAFYYAANFACKCGMSQVRTQRLDVFVVDFHKVFCKVGNVDSVAIQLVYAFCTLSMPML